VLTLGVKASRDTVISPGAQGRKERPRRQGPTPGSKAPRRPKRPRPQAWRP